MAFERVADVTKAGIDFDVALLKSGTRPQDHGSPFHALLQCHSAHTPHDVGASRTAAPLVTLSATNGSPGLIFDAIGVFGGGNDSNAQDVGIVGARIVLTIRHPDCMAVGRDATSQRIQ
jgi:hypothetical protein